MNSRPVETLGPHETRVLYQAMWFFVHLVLCLVVWAISLGAITLFQCPVGGLRNHPSEYQHRADSDGDKLRNRAAKSERHDLKRSHSDGSAHV